MIFRFLLLAAMAFTFIGVSPSVGQQKEGKKENKDVKKQNKSKNVELALEKGQGVHVYKRDKQGRIHVCYIVGKARISTIFGEDQGLLDARKAAERDCRTAYMNWIKTSVTVCEKNDNERILFKEGSKDNDKETMRESGKIVDKTTNEFKSTAEGLMRGLEPVYYETKGQTYTLVMRWKSQDAKAVKAIEQGKD
jgi:hypothetical protein